MSRCAATVTVGHRRGKVRSPEPAATAGNRHAVRIPYVAPQRIIVHVHASHAFLAASLVVLRSCGSGSREGAARAAGPEGKVLHAYNWADCIGESKIAECGVAMLDSAGDVFSVVRL
jgi:hypothetical protein